MIQIFENPYEQVSSTDLNNMQLAMAQSFTDQFLYNYVGQISGVLSSSFKASYVSALAGSLAAGVGFFYDSTQSGFNPKYRMIISASAIPFALATADGTHNRIDLVCLAPNLAISSTANRYIKTGGVGPVVLTSVTKALSDSYTLQVVTGAPGASPVAPATPSGYIAIAQCLVTAVTGMSGSGAVTDERTLLVSAVANPITTNPSSPFQNGLVSLISASGGAVNISVPSAVGKSGQQATWKKTDSSSNPVTLTGQLFDGQSTYALAGQNEFVTIVSDNVNWQVIAAG